MGSKAMEITILIVKGRQVKPTGGQQSKVKVGFDDVVFLKIESDLNIYKTKGRVSGKREKLKI